MIADTIIQFPICVSITVKLLNAKIQNLFWATEYLRGWRLKTSFQRHTHYLF